MTKATDIPAPATYLPRRLADLPLPPYRYVPGLHPHPFRHPKGHMADGANYGDLSDWAPGQPWQQDRLYLYGLDLFDARYYWECHECWEQAWKRLSRDDVVRTHLQGLVQAAASVLKQHMGHSGPASTLWATSRRRLSTVIEHLGPHARGMDLPAFIDTVEQYHKEGDWPHTQVGQTTWPDEANG